MPTTVGSYALVDSRPVGNAALIETVCFADFLRVDHC